MFFFPIAGKKGNKENMMMSMYEGQEEDGAVVIPNASITPGMSSDPPNTSLPLPLIPANLS